jgi:sulfonate transport system permease protein
MRRALSMTISPFQGRPRGSGERRDRGAVALGALSVLGFLLIWEVLNLLLGDNRGGNPLVPGPADVVGAAKKLSYYWEGGWGVARVDSGGATTWAGAGLAFLENSAATGLRVGAGFLLGLVGGNILGALVSWNPTLRRIVSLPAHGARMLPLLAMIPLFGLWFGNSNLGAVLFVAFSAFTLVFVFSINAIANVPGHYADFARSLGAGRLRVYTRVILPAAVPQLRGGIALALAFAWSAGISAEFNGQQTGLGKIAETAEYFSRTDTLALVALLVIGFAGLSFVLVQRLLGWVTRWAE